MSLNHGAVEAFDRHVCRAICEALQKAAEGVAETYGVAIQIGGGSFSSGEFKPKVTIKTKTSDRDLFASYCGLFHLRPEHFGREVTVSGARYRISGITPRVGRFPILGVRLDGKRADKTFRLPALPVRSSLGICEACHKDGASCGCPSDRQAVAFAQAWRSRP
jgi:hypothetical protein